MAGLSLALVGVVATLLTLWLVDDGSAPAPRTPIVASASPGLATQTLASLEQAVADRDADAAAALADPDDEQAQDRARQLVANARSLRVDDFTLRYVDEDTGLAAGLPEEQWAGVVETSWRFAGADRRPAQTEVTFTFATEGDRATLVSVGGGERRTPLWLSAPLEVRRAPGALVLVAGEPDGADDYARYAARAVRVVRRVLPQSQDRLVVEVPASAEDLDSVLAAEPGEYADIAAVTATTDGSGTAGAPVHVFVNPEVFGALEDQGAQVVMSHEAAHVATGAATAQTPLWLLEGFADYVALRDVDLPPAVTAGQIIAQVRDDGPPEALPGQQDFDTRTTHLGAAYEAAWIASRVLADAAGEQALVELNRRAADGDDLDPILREVAGFGIEELTRRWRQQLLELAR